MKQYTSFQMNFKTRWCGIATILLALSLLLRVIHYTILMDITGISTSNLIVFLILPILLCCIGMVLLRALRLKHPLVYSIFGTLLCVMLIVLNCSAGGTLRIVLSVVWYLFCSALLIGTALGYIPWKLPVSAAILMALIVRLLVYSMGRGLLGWIPEGADLCMLAAVFCLPRCFREVKPNT